MERISRQTDRRVYQPRLHADLIQQLYLAKGLLSLPMTVLLHTAVCEYLERIRDEYARTEPAHAGNG